MKSIPLYNQDGTLCSEAQLLLSSKPDNMSMLAWRKTLKEFRSRLSAEHLKEFKILRNKQNSAKWRTENPEKAKQSSSDWRDENPEKTKENNANWRAENPNYGLNWRAENPEKAKQNNTKQRAKNPDYINNYHKQRKAKDPLYRLQCNMRIMGNRVVKQLSLGKKPACTKKWQGCIAEELKTHFESLFTEGMTWDNYGEWHVDHIRPVCSFSAEEWEQINHYTNLQPLWAEDNYAKISSDLQQIRV